MRRGTTPTITFGTTLDLTDAEVVYLTFKQNKKTVFELEKDRLTITPTSIEVRLTQEETIKLDDKQDVYMQFASRFADGSTPRSNIVVTSVEAILKDEVI